MTDHRSTSSPTATDAEADAHTDADGSEFDCLTCGACCYQRPGTILVTEHDLTRWRRQRRQDILEQLEPGHFSQMAFKMTARGCCVHHGRPGAPHACQIYEDRSETCRAFTAGSRQCREFRRDRGIAGAPPASPSRRASSSG